MHRSSFVFYERVTNRLYTGAFGSPDGSSVKWRAGVLNYRYGTKASCATSSAIEVSFRDWLGSFVERRLPVRCPWLGIYWFKVDLDE